MAIDRSRGTVAPRRDRAGSAGKGAPRGNQTTEAPVLQLQRWAGNRAVAGAIGRATTAPLPVQRRGPQDDKRAFVREVIDFFTGASRFYDTKAEVTQRRVQAGRPPPAADATLREIGRILPSWKTTYDGARQIVTTDLGNDATLTTELRTGYESALVSLRRLAADAPRVNVILVAAPGRDDDAFIANATAYARTYFARPPSGDTVVVVEGIASLDALFSAVESAQPERMVRRVDIFAHGTIQPSNQLKLAGRWHTADQIEVALDARRLTSEHIQSATRVDARTTIEFHGCRLGGGEGEAFLGAAGRAIGGRRGQAVTGYRERWFPRRYQVNWRGHAVTDTAADIYGPQALPISRGRGAARARVANRDRFVRDFEAHALRMYDQVVSGSLEAKAFLTPQEMAAGGLSRDRKIAVMRQMYDRNGAWLLGFLNPQHQVPDLDPTRALPRDDYTFTREHEAWERRTLTVRSGP
jgi:hypothetical protein